MKKALLRFLIYSRCILLFPRGWQLKFTLFCIFLLALTYFLIPFFFLFFCFFLTVWTFLFSYFLPPHPPLSKSFSYLLPSLENGATICYPSPNFIIFLAFLWLSFLHIRKFSYCTFLSIFILTYFFLF